MNTEAKQYEFDTYKATSERLDAEANAHEEEMFRLRTQARAYENKAISMLVPYKIGDVIEFTESQGRSKRIIKHYNMEVIGFNFWFEGFEVQGIQVGKDGKKGHMKHIRKSFFVKEGVNPFVKIVKAAS